MNRIFFVNRFFWPDECATSQILTDVAFDLAAKGYDIAVISSRQRFGDSGAGLQIKETINGVEVYRVWTSSWGRANLPGRALDYMTFYVSMIYCLFRLVSKGDVVVTKTDPPMMNLFGFLICRYKSASLVNWYQDIYPEIAEKLGVKGISFLAYFLRHARDYVSRKARVNVAIGRCMGARLSKMGVADAHIRVIPNWVNDTAIVPLPGGDNPLRRDWSLTREFVIGYSGNFGRGHEFGALLEAITALVTRPDIKFLFIGEGARFQALQEESERRNLKNVIFKPFQARGNLPMSLTLPDVHVVTLQGSLEGLLVPSKFYGALAAGRPVLFLGSSLSEVALVVTEEECGFVIDDGSSEKIVTRILQLTDSPDLLIKMSGNARHAIDEKYGQNRALLAWQGVIDACLVSQ